VPTVTPPLFVGDRAAMQAGVFTLAGPEGRHATTVRRLTPGELIDVTDGAGYLVRCVILASRPGELELSVRERHEDPEPATRVVVVQAIVKGDRGELAVELMTEVGVDVIVPWAAQRSVALWRPDREDKALHRWRSTAISAAKQSRRPRFPEVTGQAQTPGVLGRVEAADLTLLLDPDAGRGLTDVEVPARGEIVLLVGPEGGVSQEETASLTQAGAVPVRLGPTVLRASTAGAVAAAHVLSRSGRWA
jgi:16S rRNA (uracil1498-N3)-methyltransferase